MKDIVVVYPKDTKSLVKKLVSKLESDNISCWVSPRDFKQEDKESLQKVIADSKVALIILDKTSRTNNELKIALEIALENQLEVIPFVVDKIDLDIYSSYFFHQVSWVDAYEDSFEQAYELLLEAYHELSGEKKSTKKKVVQKNQMQEKTKPYIYVIAVAVILIIGFFIYQAVNTDENNETIVGQWQVSNYQDNLPRNKQDSINMIQSLQGLKNSGRLIFNGDHSFERRGFSPQPQLGKWSLNPEKTVLYLEPTGETKKDIVNVEKLTDNELIIFVEEVVDSKKVTTKISFTKQKI